MQAKKKIIKIETIKLNVESESSNDFELFK